MAIRGNSNVIASSIATTAETVVAVSDQFTNEPSGEGTIIAGKVNLTLGASGTAVQVRCRQGTTVGGTLVPGSVTETHTLAAAASANIAFAFQDPANTSGLTSQQWCITVQPVAATGATTINSVQIGCSRATGQVD